MDNRGTGRSGALDCHALQQAECADGSQHRRLRSPLGERVALYSTALAADDLAAVLQALGIEQVGLYGDSYGTYFFAGLYLRHPEKLRALVLDGAYPLEGPDYPWYPHYAPAMGRSSTAPASAHRSAVRCTGSSLEHIAPALQSLRAEPVAARVRLGDGRTLAFTADATQLAIGDVRIGAGLASVREPDAAARAFVAGDSLPLLRLMAETRAGVDSRDATAASVPSSAALAAAVSCGIRRRSST